jgi:hypothetical protein
MGKLACSRGPFSQQIEPGTLGNSTSVRNAITRRVVLGSEPAHYFTSAALNQDSHDEFSAEVSAAGAFSGCRLMPSPRTVAVQVPSSVQPSV